MCRVAVWACLASVALGGMPSVAAGTVRGRLEMLEKNGQKARDLSEVVVWVEGPLVEPESASATIRMKDKQFEPRLVVVPVGGSVAFPNLDPILHNVFSVSGKNRFDLQLYKKPKSRTQTFRYPGIVRVYCNIHPQMSAFVVVRDNPFWAQASKDGRFVIEGVPAGGWVVRAWHERARVVRQKVAVPEEGTVDVGLTLDASRYRRAPHKNKHGKKYKKSQY